MLNACPLTWRATFYAVAKTCSRFGDLRKKKDCPEHRLKLLNPTQCLLMFSTTKANQDLEVREDHQVVIQQDDGLPMYLLKAAEKGKLHIPSDSDLLRFLGSFECPVPGRHFTLHSIKRGGLQELLRLSPSVPALKEGISKLGKHKVPSFLGRSTTNYFDLLDDDQMEALARNWGSGDCTRMLLPRLE
jgi:hypothetical protein